MALQRVGSQQPALRGHQSHLLRKIKWKLYLQNIAPGESWKYFSYLWSGPFPPDKKWWLPPTYTPALSPVLGGAPVHMAFWFNNKWFCAQPQPSKTQTPATRENIGGQHWSRKDRTGVKDTGLRSHQDRLWSSLKRKNGFIVAGGGMLGAWTIKYQ